ncbi:MAG: DUF368 domain-containing protein, partial [Clostridiales bacterium]|nr:DUF368 domain-containing protein [Clostridiales bacterium]
IIGIIIGIANIVPGVSAGTMFVILGIFKKLIDQVGLCLDEVKTMVKNITKYKEKNGGIRAVGIMFKNIFMSQKTFLIPIAIGMIFAIYFVAKLFSILNPEQILYRNYIFLGLILGGIPALFKELKKGTDITNIKKRKISIYIFMIIGFAMMFALYLLKVNGIGLRKVGYEELSIAMALPLFLVGAVAAASMVIPGISGSMVVLILGYYELMTVSISKLNMIFIIPFAIGILVGIMAILKLIKYLLDKHYTRTYSCIVGFVIGSLLMVFPGLPVGVMGYVITIICIAIGIMLSYMVEKYSERIKD